MLSFSEMLVAFRASFNAAMACNIHTYLLIMMMIIFYKILNNKNYLEILISNISLSEFNNRAAARC